MEKRFESFPAHTPPSRETVSAAKEHEFAAEYLIDYELRTESEKTAARIVEKLQQAGYLTYFVGGFVRDIMNGKTAKDIDITTAAPPDVVKKLFPKHDEASAKKFGMVRVIENSEAFEVTTFRTEEKSKDGRHAEDVKFVTDVYEDAQRRDFTFNALYYNPTTRHVMDFFGGLDDLQKKRLRFVGPRERVLNNQAELAFDRIEDDHVRIMRAIRFAARYDMELDPEVQKVLVDNTDLLKEESGERLYAEMTKLFVHETRVQAFEQLDELGILKVVMPEIADMHGVEQSPDHHSEGDVFAHTKKVFGSLEQVLSEYADFNFTDREKEMLVWATLYHDVGKPDTFSQEENGRIRFIGHDKKGATIVREKMHDQFHTNGTVRDTVAWLVEHHMMGKSFTTMRPSKRKTLALDERMPLLLALMKADTYGSEPQDASVAEQQKADFAATEKLYYQALEQGIAELRMQAAQIVSGKDLQTLGFESGPIMGIIIDLMREAYLTDNIPDTTAAKDWLQEHKEALVAEIVRSEKFGKKDKKEELVHYLFDHYFATK